MANEKVTVGGKPTARVTNLTAPSRSGNSLKVGWKVPAAAGATTTVTKSEKRKSGKKAKTVKVDYTYDYRFTWLDVEFYLVGSSGGVKTIECKQANNWNVTSQLSGNDKVWWRDKGKSWTECTQPYNRQKYHPFVQGRYLRRAYAVVYGGNGYGKGPLSTSATFSFAAPRAPSIDAFTLDASTQVLSTKVRTNAGTDACERYDTRYRMTRRDNFKSAYKSAKPLPGHDWAASTSTEFSQSVNMGDALGLSLSQWIEVAVEAYARGIMGDSATARRTHVFAHPAQAQVTKVSASSSNGNGLVTISCRTNSSAHRPVDRCILQRLKDTSADTAASAAVQDGWEAVEGQVDDANCTGFTDSVADAITLTDPETGKPTGNRTWYRVATYHDSMPPQYSAPVQVASLYKPAPTAADDTVSITSAESSADGTGAEVSMRWKADDSSATEVSWSDRANAWESTAQPSTFEVTWGEDVHTATLAIEGLSEGVPVYIRARRHDDAGVYGPYSDTAAVTPQSTPGNVQLSAPPYVARGRDIGLTWTFDGGTQTAWALYGPSGTALMGGQGASGNCSLPASAVPAGAASVALSVGVTTGGAWARSEPVTVNVADPPQAELSVAPVLAAQPLGIVLGTDSPGARAIVKVRAVGCTADGPDGWRVQAPGDSVWSGTVDPEWVEAASEEVSLGTPVGYDDEGEAVYEQTVQPVGTAWAADVELPAGLDLVDGASYEVSVALTDPATGLRSEERTAGFSVAWAHQALPPSGESSVEADEEALTATVLPLAPEGAREDDVCDVYRVTPDGAYAIAEGVPFGSEVTDRHAPFSDYADTWYRLCTRTADGDIAWADAYYELYATSLRLDWDGGAVELPYNIAVGDSYEKDFEERAHLDGTHAGYWNEGVSRRGSLSAALVQVESDEDQALLREMARHAGAVFVRTPDGCAYQANVDLSGLDADSGSGSVTVQLDASEVALTGEFRCSTEDVLLPGSTPYAEDGEGGE